MFNYDCPNAEKRQKGIMHYFWCKAYDNICPHQRFCPTKKDVEHTPLAVTCDGKNIIQTKIIEKEQ